MVRQKKVSSAVRMRNEKEKKRGIFALVDSNIH